MYFLLFWQCGFEDDFGLVFNFMFFIFVVYADPSQTENVNWDPKNWTSQHYQQCPNLFCHIRCRPSLPKHITSTKWNGIWVKVMILNVPSKEPVKMNRNT